MAQNIELDKVGFEPKRVRIYRMAAGAYDVAEHLKGMDDDSFLKTNGADGVRSLVASEGVTLLDTGFSVGTDDSVNNAGDTFRYFCEE